MVSNRSVSTEVVASYLDQPAQQSQVKFIQ